MPKPMMPVVVMALLSAIGAAPQSAIAGFTCSPQLAGSAPSRARGMSADGNLLLIETEAADLSRDEPAPGLFVLDLQSDSIRRVGLNREALPDTAVMDPSGRFIAYVTIDNDLRLRDLANGVELLLGQEAEGQVLLSENANRYAYVRLDQASQLVEVVNRGTGNVLFSESSNAMTLGGMSHDGTRIAFVAANSALVPEDVNTRADSYLFDSRNGALTLLSTGAAFDRSEHVTVSGDGNVAAWHEFTIGGPNDGRLVVQQLTSGATASTNRNGGPLAASFAGEQIVAAESFRIAFIDGQTLAETEADTGMTTTFVARPFVANDGESALYTRAFDAGQGDCNDLSDAFLVQNRADSERLISRARVRQVRIDNPLNGAGDRFGQTVLTQGSTVLVGAPGSDQTQNDGGAVFVFQRQGNGYQLAQRIDVPAGFFASGMGESMAIDGDTLVVGAPMTDPAAAKGANLAALQAAVFQRLGQGLFVFKQPISPALGRANDRFGSAVAISGAAIAVGAENDDTRGPGAGAAYFYRAMDDGLIGDEQKIFPSGGNKGLSGGQFGKSLALSPTRLLIGAPDAPVIGALAGSASLYDRIGQNLSQAQVLTGAGNAGDGFGQSVALSGDLIAIGSPGESSGAGSAYVFSGGALSRTTVRPPLLNPGDRFGEAISIAPTRLLVGWPGFGLGAKGAGSGAVFNFSISSGVGNTFDSDTNDGGAGVFNTGGNAPDEGLGAAVAVAGNVAVIGAPASDSDEGQVSVLIDPDSVFDGDFEGASIKLATFTEAGVPSACPEGTNHESLAYFDDFDSGAPGWIAEDALDAWSLTDNGGLADSPAWSVSAPPRETLQTLQSPVVYTIQNGAIRGADRSLVLSFFQRRVLGADAGVTQCRDGGRVREDAGRALTVVDDVFEDPYDAVIRAGFGNPMEGADAWCGDVTWRRTSMTVERGTDGATLTVQIPLSYQWQLGTDNRGINGSWIIDNVMVEFCVDMVSTR